MFPLSHTERQDLSDAFHPSHRGGTKEGMTAVMIICLAGVVFWYSVDVSWISRFWKIQITFAVAIPIGWLVAMWVKEMQSSKSHSRSQEYRDMREAETQMKIDEMHRKNSRIPQVARDEK